MKLHVPKSFVISSMTLLILASGPRAHGQKSAADKSLAVIADPWIQNAVLTGSDAMGSDFFGYSIAMDGNTVVVGSPFHNEDQGAAYVFVRSGGKWTQQAKLTASDGAELDEFGSCVAVNGSTIVVGAPFHSVGSNLYQGAAYVFVENGGTWTQQVELTASDGGEGDFFGSSIVVSASTIAVGALVQPVGSSQLVGAAYVFSESGGTWTQQAELRASDATSSDSFGSSVAISGGTLVVGDDRHTVGANQSQGAAYVFVESGGTWKQHAELIASDGTANEQFGTSVAISGSTVAVGAPNHPVGTNQFQGAAYVFVESGGIWTQQAELISPDGAWLDQFGSSVAVSGSTVLVGASNHPSPQPPPYIGGPGAAYMFTQSNGTWTQQQELFAYDGLDSGRFGLSVAVGGGTAVVGAAYHSQGVNSAGQAPAYVFGSSGPLYTLSGVPSSLSFLPGGQATSTISITPWNGFSGSVSLSPVLLPSGVTASFDPNPATTTTTLTLTANATAAEGTSEVVLNGASGSLNQTAGSMLTVLQAPEVKLVPPSLNFGNQVINTSAGRGATLRNVGEITLNFTNNPVITPSTSFKISQTFCGNVVFPHKSCTVSVQFEPTSLGKQTASLVFTDDAFGSPQAVSLSGTGVEPAALTPASLAYATRKVGTTSPARAFLLTNNQLVALTSIAISTTGDFALSTTTCGTSLAAKAKCMISVTFTPTKTGNRTGQLSITDSAVNSAQTASLTGTGD